MTDDWRSWRKYDAEMGALGKRLAEMAGAGNGAGEKLAEENDFLGSDFVGIAVGSNDVGVDVVGRNDVWSRE